MNESNDLILGLPQKQILAPGHKACNGCGSALALRIALAAAGPNTIISIATGCMSVVTMPYPQTAFNCPTIHSAFENTAATASGIEAALKFKGERKNVNVIAIGGDGGLFDIGLQALSGALERRQDFLTLCYDNEGYQNTGMQRSSATPKYAWTSTTPAGKTASKKPLPLIVAEHGSPYVATACIGDELDFAAKVRKALSIRGPTFIHVLTPCIPGWKIQTNETIDLGKLAIETGVQPLYEIENGRLKFTHPFTKRRRVEEYLRPQGRFKHLTSEQVKTVQKTVDGNYYWLLSLAKKGQVFPK